MLELDVVVKDIDEIEAFEEELDTEKGILQKRMNKILRFIFWNSKRNNTPNGRKAKFEHFNIWVKDTDSNYKIENKGITYFYEKYFHPDLPEMIPIVLDVYLRVYNGLNAQYEKERGLVDQLKEELK